MKENIHFLDMFHCYQPEASLQALLADLRVVDAEIVPMERRISVFLKGERYVPRRDRKSVV